MKSKDHLNYKDGKFFYFSADNESYPDKISFYLKKEDLEWLGFNWFRFRVGLLAIDNQYQMMK